MMKVSGQQGWLLLDPPSSVGHARRASIREKENAPNAPFPSIDLILLSGVIREAGFSPIYLDAQIRRWSWEQLIARARGLDAVGTVSLVSSGRLDEELAQLERFKRALGGALYVVAPISLSLSAERCRALMEQHPWLGGLILNIAENDFGPLIAGNQTQPRNVAVRIGNDIHLPSAAITYVEDLHIPQPVHAIFKDSRYYFPQTKHAPVTCVQVSFGCPYRCEFCLDNAQYSRMSYRRVADVIEELVEIDRLGFREVYFKDLTFGLNKRVTVEFLEGLKSRKLRLRWLCTTRVDVATARLLTLMRQAGCYGVEFGVESGQQRRRALNGKPIPDEQIHEVFNRCRQLGIETTAFVIIGFEDETEEEIRATMRFIESLRPDYVSYNVLNALPGTPLEQRARAEGFLQDETNNHSFAASNLRHKYLTPEQLEALRSEAVRSFYRRPRTTITRLLRLRSLFELRKLVRLSRAAL